MSDNAPYAAQRPSEDRTLAIVVYALLIAGMFTSGVTSLIGVILAYVKRDTPDPVAASHHRFAIGCFWLGFWGVVIGVLVMLGGGLTMAWGGTGFQEGVHNEVANWPVFVTGVSLLIVGGLLLFGVHIAVLVRTVYGLIKLADGKPIGR